MYKLKVGADPELFLKKGRSYVCAEGVIPGSKDNPHIVKSGAVQVDGMAVEFNIDPAESAEEFVSNIQTVMATLDYMVGEHELVCKPSVVFNATVWAGASEDSKILGCEPDYNAHTGEVNPKPNANVRFRTAAGHVHIGWTEGADIKDPNHILECEAIVKELDYRLGFPSLKLDDDSRRRKLYGAAGAYRPKSYGLEYRVLSNFWLQSEEYQTWIFNTVEATLSDLLKGKNILHNKYNNTIYDPVRVIDNNSVDTARGFVNAFHYLTYPDGFKV